MGVKLTQQIHPDRPQRSNCAATHRQTSPFECDIRVGRGDEWVDGRSILSLLSLAASRGTALRIRAEGADALAAVEALGRLLEDSESATDSSAR